ncbi:MAG: hypothetical protein ACRCZF_18225, partial [Gemmataceae bacterium]
MEPIRVCFMIDDLSRAGTEMQLLGLLQHLDREVVAPTLVLLNGEQARAEGLLPTHLPTLCLGLPRLRSSRLFSAVKQLRHFWRTHRTEMFQ